MMADHDDLAMTDAGERRHGGSDLLCALTVRYVSVAWAAFWSSRSSACNPATWVDEPDRDVSRTRRLPDTA
jgi:hypothetical protein